MAGRRRNKQRSNPEPKGGEQQPEQPILEPSELWKEIEASLHGVGLKYSQQNAKSKGRFVRIDDALFLTDAPNRGAEASDREVPRVEMVEQLLTITQPPNCPRHMVTSQKKVPVPEFAKLVAASESFFSSKGTPLPDATSRLEHYAASCVSWTRAIPHAANVLSALFKHVIIEDVPTAPLSVASAAGCLATIAMAKLSTLNASIEVSLDADMIVRSLGDAFRNHKEVDLTSSGASYPPDGSVRLVAVDSMPLAEVGKLVLAPSDAPFGVLVKVLPEDIGDIDAFVRDCTHPSHFPFDSSNRDSCLMRPHCFRFAHNTTIGLPAQFVLIISGVDAKVQLNVNGCVVEHFATYTSYGSPDDPVHCLKELTYFDWRSTEWTDVKSFKGFLWSPCHCYDWQTDTWTSNASSEAHAIDTFLMTRKRLVNDGTGKVVTKKLPQVSSLFVGKFRSSGTMTPCTESLGLRFGFRGEYYGACELNTKDARVRKLSLNVSDLCEAMTQTSTATFARLPRDVLEFEILPWLSMQAAARSLMRLNQRSAQAFYQLRATFDQGGFYPDDYGQPVLRKWYPWRSGTVPERKQLLVFSRVFPRIPASVAVRLEEVWSIASQPDDKSVPRCPCPAYQALPGTQYTNVDELFETSVTEVEIYDGHEDDAAEWRPVTTNPREGWCSGCPKFRGVKLNSADGAVCVTLRLYDAEFLLGLSA